MEVRRLTVAGVTFTSCMPSWELLSSALRGSEQQEVAKQEQANEKEEEQQQFDPVLALWFSYICSLAYEEEDTIKTVVTEVWGWEGFRFLYDEETDTQGYLMWNEAQLVLAFRGSESIQDWLTNFHFGTVESFVEALKEGEDEIEVHEGFTQALSSVWGPAEELILQLRSERPSLRFYITGHSLGGALASLAFCRCILRAEPIHVDGTYTFGQPVVGNKALKMAIKARTQQPEKRGTTLFRFVNNNDIVPFLPCSPPYKHYGTSIYISTSGEFIHKPEFLKKAIDRVQGWGGSLFFHRHFDSWADHSISKGYLPWIKTLFTQRYPEIATLLVKDEEEEDVAKMKKMKEKQRQKQKRKKKRSPQVVQTPEPKFVSRKQKEEKRKKRTKKREGYKTNFLAALYKKRLWEMVGGKKKNATMLQEFREEWHKDGGKAKGFLDLDDFRRASNPDKETSALNHRSVERVFQMFASVPLDWDKTNDLQQVLEKGRLFRKDYDRASLFVTIILSTFAAVDTDHNGAISKEEFIGAWEALMPLLGVLPAPYLPSEEALRQYFDAIVIADTNSEKEKEIASSIAFFQHFATLCLLLPLFFEADRNMDGETDVEELVACLRASFSSTPAFSLSEEELRSRIAAVAHPSQPEGEEKGESSSSSSLPLVVSVDAFLNLIATIPFFL
ncbi:Phospholipase A(1) chloroplastic [Balamuthia mandrillaris]